MLTRRRFLHSSVVAGLGLLTSVDRAAAQCDPPLTDWKRNWDLVRQNSRPFSPERVVIMNQDAVGDLPPRSARLESWKARLELPPERFDLIVRLTQIMAEPYGVPFDGCAIGLARREALGSAPIGRGCGLVHQFQDSTPVRLVNPPVDWWLFLFPEGSCWESLDDRPVFGMIGHVFPAHHWDLPAFKLRIWELTARVAWTIGAEDSRAWERISGLDQGRAAGELNRVAARCIVEL